MTASEAGRDLIYYTFNHRETVKSLSVIMNIIDRENLNIGKIYNLIKEYSNEIKDLSSKELKHFNLSEFLATKFSHL
jgi:hypothetical protein